MATATQVEFAIAAARERPDAFLSLCIGRHVVGLQRQMLAHALAHPSWYAELPRGHAKTSTYAHLLAWMIGRRPSLRAKIISQTDPDAAETSRFVQDIVTSEVFHACFPDIKLHPRRRGVEAWAVLAPGMASKRDATVKASGILGRTGGRADILWLDDVCDLRNAILNPGDRAKVKEAYANVWLPMLDATSRHTTRTWRTATPWHTDDITADWRKSAQKRGTLLRTPCVGLVSPWPEFWTPELLAERQEEMGPIGYARAYELVPLSADLLVFKPEWLMGARWDTLPPEGRLMTVAAIDFAYTAKSAQKPDPDWSVCIVAKVDFSGEVYAIEMLRMRTDFPAFESAARDLMGRHGCKMAFVEANGPQKGIVDAFQRNCRVPLVPMPRDKDKMSRAVDVQAFVAAGKFRLPAQGSEVRGDFTPCYEEMVCFPAGNHDDCLDAAVDLCAAALRGIGTGASPRASVPASAPAVGRMYGGDGWLAERRGR